MSRVLGGLVLVVALVACGDSGRQAMDGGGVGGVEPYCAMVDAGPPLDWDWGIVCPDGTAEVCGDARWECDAGGWVLVGGDSPSCDINGDLVCVDGEPRCAPLPDC